MSRLILPSYCTKNLSMGSSVQFIGELAPQAAFAEPLMSERVNSFAQTIFGSILVSFATLAVGFGSSAMAADACIEKLPPSVAEGMPKNAPDRDATCRSCYFTTEVLLWDVRYDRVAGRTCWFLRDAHGRDVTEAHVRSRAAQTPTSSTLSSTLASWFENLNFLRASANSVPESKMASVSPPEPSPQRESDTANEKSNRVVRISQRSSSEQRSSAETNAAKRASQPSSHQEARALFEEFEEYLRWREHQKMFGH
jgi:hypothetical protein